VNRRSQRHQKHDHCPVLRKVQDFPNLRMLALYGLFFGKLRIM